MELFSKITAIYTAAFSIGQTVLHCWVWCSEYLVCILSSQLLPHFASAAVVGERLDSVSRGVYGVMSLSFGNCWCLFCPQSVDVFVRFYRRWKETEAIEAQLLNFSLEESQCEHDWTILLSLASQPGKKFCWCSTVAYYCFCVCLLGWLVRFKRVFSF